MLSFNVIHLSVLDIQSSLAQAAEFMNTLV